MFTATILLAIVVLLTVVYAMRLKEFNAFPTILLFATFLGLALKVASTRVVLVHGHEGPNAVGQAINALTPAPENPST